MIIVKDWIPKESVKCSKHRVLDIKVRHMVGIHKDMNICRCASVCVCVCVCVYVCVCV